MRMMFGFAEVVFAARDPALEQPCRVSRVMGKTMARLILRSIR